MANNALSKPLTVSPELAAVVGEGPMPATEVTKKIWEYIKAHNLQDPNNKRDIVPDEKLAAVFGTTDKVNMFKMTGLVRAHLS